MNRETLDFMTPAESQEIANDVGDLMSGTHVTVALTYRDYLSVAITPSTGAATPSYTDIALRGVRNLLSAHEVQAGSGMYQMGDVRYLVSRAALTISPTREDRVVEGAVTFELISWNTDPLGRLWNLIARQVKK